MHDTTCLYMCIILKIFVTNISRNIWYDVCRPEWLHSNVLKTSKKIFVTKLLCECSIFKLKIHLISGKVTKAHTRYKHNQTIKVMRKFDVEKFLEKQLNIESSFAQTAKWRSLRLQKQSEWKGAQKVHSKNKENIGDSYVPLLEYKNNYLDVKYETLSDLLTP